MDVNRGVRNPPVAPFRFTTGRDLPMRDPAADTWPPGTNAGGPLRWDIRTTVVALATACVAATGVTVGG